MASGGHARPSSRQGLEDLRKPKEGVGVEKNHNNGVVPEMDMVGVVEGGLAKFTEQVGHKGGIAVFSGDVSNRDGISAEKEGDDDMDRFGADSNLKNETHSIFAL